MRSSLYMKFWEPLNLPHLQTMSSQGRALPDPDHFFQIIGKNSLRNGELRIPRSFVRKHWQGISNPLLLVLPNGAKWEMKWEKRDVDVWLASGWSKFAEFCSLYKDQFLLFKYEGKSQFEVIILHPFALEIEYPSPNGTFEGEDSDDNSIEILDGISSSRHGKRPKSPLPHSHSPKKKKINTKEYPESYPSNQKFHAGSDDAIRPKTKGGRRNFSKSEEESSSAVQRAKAFISGNPWFIRIMPPKHTQRYCLPIPGKNVTTQEQEKNDSVTLWVSEERTWRVKFCRNICNGQISLTTGWKSFVEDNKLRLGDVCVFEKYECRGASFRIVIFRATQESTPAPSQAYGDGASRRRQTFVQNNLAGKGCDGTPKECSKTNVFNDSNNHRDNSKVSKDHFTLTLRPSHLKSATHIPIGFIRNYAHNAKHVQLHVGERSWQVKLDYYPRYSYGRLSAGWPTFVRDGNLKKGDDCFFQLIDKDNLSLQVKVSRRIH